MPIPTSRDELVQQMETSYDKLRPLLLSLRPRDGSLRCVDDWSIKDLLLVRAWWTEQLPDWIEWGRQQREFDLPASGYRWSETPRLNADIVRRSQRESLARVVTRIDNAYKRNRQTIDSLSDPELVEPMVFVWAGKWPLARWFSINTIRQYATARTYLRRGLAAKENRT